MLHIRVIWLDWRRNPYRPFCNKNFSIEIVLILQILLWTAIMDLTTPNGTIKK